MKIAYLLPINTEKYEGVLNKIESQISAWAKQDDISIRLFLLTANKKYSVLHTALGKWYEKGYIEIYYMHEVGVAPVDLLKDWLGVRSVYTDVLNSLKLFNPDIVYMRSGMYQPFHRRLTQQFRLIVEVNTDFDAEYRLQRFQSLKYFLRNIYYKMTSDKYYRDVSGVAAVTFEIAEKMKDIRTGVFPNSINITNYAISEKPVNDEKRIVFIGTPEMPWQGLDILVQLAEKLPEVTFDIIGFDGNGYRNKMDNINFYGFLRKEQYLSLIYKATAAIGTLALFRKSMNEACPLKVREYLACCKPVILPYKDTAFELKGYPDWVLRLENDKEKILDAVDEIRSFLEKCDGFNLTRQEVKPYVDVEFIEKERISFFKEITKKNV